MVRVLSKTITIIFFLLFFIPQYCSAQQHTVVTGQDSSFGTRLETGSVNPMYGGPGIYTFQTILINPQGKEPDYVKIFIQKGDGKSGFQGLAMTKGITNSQGTEYHYTTTFKEKDEGKYDFYFEAKIGGKTIHGPSYGGEGCEPGMCAQCCGAWSGPKIISAKLIKENKIYLFQKGNDNPVWSYNVGKNWVTSVVFSADGKYFAAADNNQNVYLFDIRSNIPKWVFAGTTKETGDLGMDKGIVVFSKNGDLAASLKGTVYLFKINSNKPVWNYSTPMVLNGLVISEDGRYLAAAGRDTNVYFWDLGKTTPTWVHKIEAKGGLLGGSVIISMSMSPNGKYFVAGTSCPDRSVHVFTPSQADEIFQAKAGTNFPVGTVSISDDGRYFLAGGGGDPEDPYTAVLYTIDKKDPVWRFDHSRNPVSEVAISSDAKSCVIGSNMDGLFFNDCSSKDPVWQLQNAGQISAVVISKDGKWIAGGSLTDHVFLLPADGSKILHDWKIGSKVESLGMSADGTYIAAGTGLNRYFATSAAGENTSGAGGKETIDAKIQLVRLQGASLKPDTKSAVNNPSRIGFYAILIISLISAISLVMYIIAAQLKIFVRNGKQLLVFDKKVVVIWFIVTMALFILVVTVSIFTHTPPSPIEKEPQKNTIINTIPSGKYQEGESGKCGNHVCEGAVGETKQNCPKDCTGEEKN